jgi:DNA-binding HxlR family transcriptional regulator
MARTYADRCGIARALDVVGERWALLVVRELLLGPKRFSDLKAGLPGIGPDVLSQRLRDLEAHGVLERRTLAPPASVKVYALTPRGAALEPVVLALGRWGSVAPFPDAEATIGVDAFVLALKTLHTGGGARGRFALVLDGQPFRAELGGDGFTVARGETDDADATITAHPPALARAMWHGGDLGAVEITGDRAAAERFLAAFPLPA